jgi:hypothetical protein
VAPESVRGKSAAAEAGVTKATVPPSAAKTTTMTASAAMTAAAAGDGAGGQYGCAERNDRGEHNACHRQPHESLSSEPVLSACCWRSSR